MPREADFQQIVASELTRAGMTFERQVSTRGLCADFLVRAPDGRRYVVEAKAWDKHPGFQARAAHQAELIQEIADADGAFVVVQGLERSDLKRGALTLDRLVPTLEAAFQQKPGRREPPAREATAPQGTAFAAMPFDELYDDTFLVAMTFASHRCGLVCERIDRREFTGNIVQEVQARIRNAAAVIADLSGSNPNVLYEVGFAHALDKPTVHVCATPLDELPFDVAQWNTISYTIGRASVLKKPLARRLRAVLA